MAIFSPEAKAFPLPKLYPVQQIIPDDRIAKEDIPGIVEQEIAKEEIRSRLEAGKTACVLVGSRGIDNIAIVVHSVITELKRYGVKPYIIPAMGSHGGAIAENQRGILAGYGITEETTGVEIRAGMKTKQIATSESGIPVYADVNALDADYIIPVNRVKVHTDFKGPIESGVSKMMVIGLGKHDGCSRVHQAGFKRFPVVIPELAKASIEANNVPFGFALVENGHDHTHLLAALPGDEIIEREKKLLELSKSLMPTLHFDQLDVLIVDQIGKDISGAGMDPNITGRVAGRDVNDWGFDAPKISRIVLNHISEGSHGSGVGMGCAEFITQSFFDQIDFEATYANQIASCVPENAFTPMVMPTEEDALRGAIVTSLCPDWSAARVARIKDTLHLGNIEVSESLLDECRKNPNFIVPDSFD